MSNRLREYLVGAALAVLIAVVALASPTPVQAASLSSLVR